MTGISHNDTNMKIKHQHTTKCVHCYIFMNNTSELRMSWILGNITQLCIHVYTVHEFGCIHIVTFCPTYIRYMNQGIYIYIVTFCPPYIHVKQKYKLWLFVRQGKTYRLWLFVVWLSVLGVLWLFVQWLSVRLPYFLRRSRREYIS